MSIERYGRGTPDDWLEHHVYARYVKLGMTLMGIADVVLFGIVPGALILITQLAWIPFWAAGVINGIGHYWGYRHWSTPDASTNIVPVGILIGGEELHNNHHAYPTSAKLSNKWYEFDIGWLYIRILEALGLAKVKHVAPVPHLASPKPVPDLQTLHAVITHRYELLARYGELLKCALAEDQDILRHSAARNAWVRQYLEEWLQRDEKMLREPERAQLSEILSRSRVLQTLYAMRRELAALWKRSTASREQLVKQLQDWCRRAEASGISPLASFSRSLRSYT